MEKSKSKSMEIPDGLLPLSFNSGVHHVLYRQKLVSSLVALVRPLDSPESPPWMVVSVETSRGVTELYNPITRKPIAINDDDDNVDLSRFSTTRLATECHIVREGGAVFHCSERSQPFHNKALLFFPENNNNDNCVLFVTFNHNGSVKECRHPFNGRDDCYQSTFHPTGDWCYIEDIIKYKGNVYSLDRSEQLFTRSKRLADCPSCGGFGQFHFCAIAAHKNPGYKNGKMRIRKRLAVSLSGETLYMIDPATPTCNRPSNSVGIYFTVSVLDHANKVWRRVTNFVDDDDDDDAKHVVLFVTREYCFFVAAHEFPGCQLSNCIVFSADAFPVYCLRRRGWHYDNSNADLIVIFSMGDQRAYSLPVDSYPGFPLMLWTPPPWISSRSPSNSQSEAAEAEDIAMTQSTVTKGLDLGCSQGWVKLRRCKCEPPKYCDIKIYSLMNKLGQGKPKPYYECYQCGEIDWVGEAEFMRSNEGTNTIVTYLSELKASMGKLLTTNAVVIIIMTLFMCLVLFLSAILR